jgi:hypothetical protein
MRRLPPRRDSLEQARPRDRAATPDLRPRGGRGETVSALPGHTADFDAPGFVTATLDRQRTGTSCKPP